MKIDKRLKEIKEQLRDHSQQGDFSQQGFCKCITCSANKEVIRLMGELKEEFEDFIYNVHNHAYQYGRTGIAEEEADRQLKNKMEMFK